MSKLSGIEPPRMNWLATDPPTEFRSFRQYCELIFSGPFAVKQFEAHLKGNFPVIVFMHPKKQK